MGCGSSLQDLPYIEGKKPAIGHHHHPVNIVTERDIHEVYDFTGPVLGKGSFATVLRVRDRKSGSEYAVKQIDLDIIKDSPSSMEMIDRECRTMMALNHPNIVRLQEVYRPPSGDHLYMVLDRLEGGSVDGLWREQGKLSEDHASHIILQVVSAVRYCHDKGIAHRDLKMENSMFEDASVVPIVKVIDFGLCAELHGRMTSRAFVGTVLYTAPEILKVDGHGLACDLWSIGVMAYALISGEFPWHSKSHDICGQMIKYSDLKFPQETWGGVPPLCRNFIERCLVKNPKNRITAVQAQQHPWLKKAARDMEGSPLSRGAMVAMLNYQNGNTFKKIVMELVAYSYEPSQIKDLELEFLRMDKRGDGVISLEDFKSVLLERWAELKKANVASTPPALEGGDRKQDGLKTSSIAKACSGSEILTPSFAGDNLITPTNGKAEIMQQPASTKTTGAGNALVNSVEGRNSGPQRSEPNPREISSEDGLDYDVLQAALLAVQASQSVSRKALRRTLSVSVRTSTNQYSGMVSAEESLDSSRTSRVKIGKSKGKQRLIPTMDEGKAEEIFRSMDLDNSGTIDFTEFVAGCLVEKQVGEAALHTAFDRLDQTRSGLISMDDIRMYLGEDFREEEISRNMRAISSREDDQVSYDDFQKCILGGAQPNPASKTGAISRSASFKSLSRHGSSNSLSRQGSAIASNFFRKAKSSGDLKAQEDAAVAAVAASLTAAPVTTVDQLVQA